MSKRRVQFADHVEQHIDDHIDDPNDDHTDGPIDERIASDHQIESEYSDKAFGKKFKHTLDSDEEDDEKTADNYNVLNVDNIGGEDCNIDFDGDIRITPFNMKEELEEGHFDKEGTYIFHKEDNIRDSWLDNIDWVQVKHVDREDKDDDTDDSDEREKTDFDWRSCYRDMIALMNANETVKRAIQRLGNTSANSTKFNRRKKSDHEMNTNNVSENEICLAKENLSKLSSLADKALQNGDMDIYERTFEHLNYQLNNKSEPFDVSSNCDDMFSENFEAKDDVSNEKSNHDQKNNYDNEIKWEFRWKDDESEPVYGPHTSQQMLDWVNEGYFENGVFVRQMNKTDSKFYNSRRIDFELYI